jgi:hypothetical protein
MLFAWPSLLMKMAWHLWWTISASLDPDSFEPLADFSKCWSRVAFSRSTFDRMMFRKSKQHKILVNYRFG